MSRVNCNSEFEDFFSYATGMHSLPEFLQNSDYTQLEPSVIQPLTVYLDNAGEIYRDNLVTLSRYEDIEQLCLRPDYTISIVRHLLDSYINNHYNHLQGSEALGRKFKSAVSKNNTLKISYSGPIFKRQSPDEGASKVVTQLNQVGIEHIGSSNQRANEIEEVLTTASMLWGAYGDENGIAKVGDVELVDCLVKQAEFNRDEKSRVWRAMAHHRDADKVISSLSPRALPTNLVRIKDELIGVPEGERYSVFHKISTKMISENFTSIVGRTEEQILHHSWLRIENSLNSLTEIQEQVIRSLLEIKCSITEVSQKLDSIARQFSIDLDSPTEKINRISNKLISMVPSANIMFEGHPHRALTYYTGLTFWLNGVNKNGEDVSMRGGEYDNLFSKFNQDVKLKASGCALSVNKK